jgi:hypothetical protein
MYVDWTRPSSPDRHRHYKEGKKSGTLIMSDSDTNMNKQRWWLCWHSNECPMHSTASSYGQLQP